MSAHLLHRRAFRHSGRETSLLQAAIAALICCVLTACAPPATLTAEVQAHPARPSLEDFWEGRASFQLDQEDTGLPMGESDTVILPDGTFRSYVHASHPSLGVVDQCGDLVPFPGCVVTFTSADNGRTFTPATGSDGTVSCLLPCMSCPCESRRDHIDQQQYPRVTSPSLSDGDIAAPWLMVYEYRGSVFMAQSPGGLAWTRPAELPQTGIWKTWLMPCRSEESIGDHPYAPDEYDCLVGSPPGLYVDHTDGEAVVYVFVGLGQNPSAMGCYRGPLGSPPALLRKCDHNPLFVGNPAYGPSDETSPAANPHFDFRTISSADVIRVGSRAYMFFEGVRGPEAGAAGDTQFALGLARSVTAAIDGPWETYPGNPILVDLPGNVGVGHADVLLHEGVTWLYTSLDGEVRSRLRLVWN